MAKAHKLTGVEPLRSYRENARTVLPQKVEEVWTWEPFIRDAARREELHNMRISIKRLRYTMELFRVVYQSGCQQSAVGSQKETFVAKKRDFTGDSRYVEFLKVIVDLQEILGDVHDSDVVLEVLTDYASESGSENQGGRVAVRSGVAKLIARTRVSREVDYETFLEKWEYLSATGFKQKLLSLLAE